MASEEGTPPASTAPEASPEEKKPAEHTALVSPSEEAVGEAAVVHAAAEIPYRIEERPEGWAVLTDPEDAPASARELTAYAAENAQHERPAEPQPVVGIPGGWAAGIAWAVALIAFHFVATSGYGAVPWVERGASNAAKVLHGEPWRVVTALTLHADFAHVLANAAACVLFVGVVARWLGPGLGSLLVLAAGAGGNALNAWYYGTRHISLGASTTTFGAIGLLGALQFGRLWTRKPSRRAAWPAIAASVGLFAMLGTSLKSDVMAHLAGLGVGLALGIAAAFALRGRKAPSEPVQAVFVGLTVTTVVLAWLVALR
ncbi:MAG TPA: rhomboid family intramembrane serine protease [Myxococcales bacterium]|jgi:membrane associated rhomboid family serine protease